MTNPIKIKSLPENNYLSFFDRVTQKTQRFITNGADRILPLEYPEVLDVSLGDFCSLGCKYCYANASKRGSWGTNIFEKIDGWFGSMTPNQRPHQIACLDGDTPVGTPIGMIKIKDLQVGDEVFGADGEISTVRRTSVTEKAAIKLTGNKGFSVICSEDHIFIDEHNNQIFAKDLIGKKLRTARFHNFDTKPRIVIDLAEYINKSSRVKGNKGGSSGGAFTEDKVRLMHTMSWVNRYVELNEDVMWLYGITIAEGYKRGLSLHAKEMAYANRAVEIYKKITGGLGATIRQIRENSIVVEFHESKNYATLFLDIMGIGREGSHHKTCNFIFNLPNNLVKAALIGMFDGDGCYRIRGPVDGSHQNGSFTAKYKCASKELVQEITYLLQSRFGVFSSYKESVTKKRKIESRLLKEAVCYITEITSRRDFRKMFSEIFSHVDSLFAEAHPKCSHKDYIVINAVETVGVRPLYDISLDVKSSRLFTINGGIVTHNCGGASEPTQYDRFTEVLDKFTSLDILPNYTTNGVKVTDEILEACLRNRSGVAVSTHSHIEKTWKKAAYKYSEAKIRTNLHIIVGESGSCDRLKSIYEEFKDKIEYFVLLPYQVAGRATFVDTEPELHKVFQFVDELTENGITSLAVGALFTPFIKKHKNNYRVLNDVQDGKPKMGIYESEVLSGYVKFDDDEFLIRKSSYDLRPKFVAGKFNE